MKKIVIGACLFVLGVLVGVLLGFREGQVAFLYLDGVPRGVLASSQLAVLDQGNQKPARFYLEQDIDQGLYYYSLVQDQWWHPLYASHLLVGAAPGDLDTYATKLAQYRRQHPGPGQDPTIFDKVPAGKEEHAAFYAELAEAQHDRVARIKAVIRARGSQ